MQINKLGFNMLGLIYIISPKWEKIDTVYTLIINCLIK